VNLPKAPCRPLELEVSWSAMLFVIRTVCGGQRVLLVIANQDIQRRLSRRVAIKVGLHKLKSVSYRREEFDWEHREELSALVQIA
jgi:hypothetical protein